MAATRIKYENETEKNDKNKKKLNDAKMLHIIRTGELVIKSLGL